MVVVEEEEESVVTLVSAKQRSYVIWGAANVLLSSFLGGFFPIFHPLSSPSEYYSTEMTSGPASLCAAAMHRAAIQHTAVWRLLIFNDSGC